MDESVGHIRTRTYMCLQAVLVVVVVLSLLMVPDHIEQPQQYDENTAEQLFNTQHNT